MREFDQIDRPFVMLGAVLVALIWPLVLTAWLLARWLDSTPVRSRREVAAERAAMAQRIGELEQQLGMTGRTNR